MDKLRKALKNIEDIVRRPFLGKNNYLIVSESFELLKGLIDDYESLQKENEELKNMYAKFIKTARGDCDFCIHCSEDFYCGYDTCNVDNNFKQFELSNEFKLKGSD